MWTRQDWETYYSIARQRWPRQRPLRPVDRASVLHRLVPAEGYSLAELTEAGLSVERAESLGLPVDIGRVGSYSPNVSSLRAFVRVTRTRY
jgi:ribosomal protein L13E